MNRILPILLVILIATIVALRAAAAGAGGALAQEVAAGPELDVPPILKPAAEHAAETLTEMPLAEMPGAAGATSSPLRGADARRERSVQLEQVAQQADRQIRHGFELAGRSAYFAARTEFIAGLRLIAEGLDTEQQTSFHTRALAAGLTAINEAEDFLPGGSRVEADVDLQNIIVTHSTPVLQGSVDGLTPLMALRCYMTFAQEQFAAAAGGEVAGSMALHAMGKLHAALAEKKVVTVVAAESKAVVFFQAALLAYPKNSMAANDLGVLLARCGHYADARAMLQHSLSLTPQAVGWQNLATVHRQLGNTALAEQALRQAALLRQRDVAQRRTSSVAASGAVRWVDPQNFVKPSTSAPGAAPAAEATASTASPSTNQAAEPSAVAGGRSTTLRPPTAALVAPGNASTASAGNWPAPTPAAAQRRTWNAAAYR